MSFNKEVTAIEYIEAEIPIFIKGITLMGAGDITGLPLSVLKRGSSWWLKTKAPDSDTQACCIDKDGYIEYRNLTYTAGGVRPVLLLGRCYNLTKLSKVYLFGLEWIAVSQYKLLCDRILDQSAFNYPDSPYKNVFMGYENSQISAMLNGWLNFQLDCYTESENENNDN